MYSRNPVIIIAPPSEDEMDILFSDHITLITLGLSVSDLCARDFVFLSHYEIYIYIYYICNVNVHTYVSYHVQQSTTYKFFLSQFLALFVFVPSVLFSYPVDVCRRILSFTRVLNFVYSVFNSLRSPVSQSRVVRKYAG